MKIGLMSDSHGNVERTRRAARRLREAGVTFVLHAGDVGGVAVLDVLSEELGVHSIPVVAVEGNMDRGWPGLRNAVTGPGVHVAGPRWRGQLDGCRVALFHGDDGYFLDSLLRSHEVDLIVSGHSHRRSFRSEDGVIRVNPGALHRTTEPGVAWYDTESNRCTYIDVK